MTQAIKLTITNFDPIENYVSDAEFISEEQIFIDDKEKNAYTKCSEYLASCTFKPFLGYNLEVYPKIQVERIWMK
jgi:hypothetical protein